MESERVRDRERAMEYVIHDVSGIFAQKIRFVVCLRDPQILNLMKFPLKIGVASAQFDLINLVYFRYIVTHQFSLIAIEWMSYRRPK